MSDAFTDGFCIKRTTMRYAHVANGKVKADHQKYMQ